jgi:hypothetical protein
MFIPIKGSNECSNPGCGHLVQRYAATELLACEVSKVSSTPPACRFFLRCVFLLAARDVRRLRGVPRHEIDADRRFG